MTDINAGSGPADPDLLAVADKTKAWLRTVFPAAWAALITWVISLGVLPQAWVTWVDSLGTQVVLLVVLALVYPLFRLIEKWNPPKWLVHILLGSAKQPVYVPQAVGVAVDKGAVIPALVANPAGGNAAKPFTTGL